MTAVGFVVVVAALFAGVGAWQDREVTAGPPPAEPAPAPAPVPEPAPEDSDPDGADTDDDGTAPDGADTEPEPSPPATGPRPQDVTVQLLNGAGDTNAVAGVRSLLTEAGFRIAASNPGRAYDVTTVFYTVGFEAEGRLVASVLATEAVFPMTDLPPERRLSAGVMVHVVVGADRR